MLRGNCSFHKEWIGQASLTTCSDMSLRRLRPAGIYQLEANDEGEWSYVRRQREGEDAAVLGSRWGRKETKRKLT